MLGLQVIVAVGFAILIGSLVSRRWGVTAPVALIAAGVAASAIPALRAVGLPPEVVLLLFLPALLFWESLTTSSREIRRNLRGIIISGTFFVIATAATVAVVAHALGLGWATSWLIGAAVAPTDATAVSSIGSLLPRRGVTVLRAESLINDGTALVIYALVLESASGEDAITTAHVSWLLTRSFVGGVLVGLAAGWAATWIRRRLSDPMLNTVTLVLTPFAAYLLAEEIHASGVLAVVTCGLFLAQVAPRLISAQARQLAGPFWTVSTFLLNGALFVLIGMELPSAIDGLSGGELGRGLLVMAAVYATVLATRFVALNATILTIRLVDRRPTQRLRRTKLRDRIVSTAAGFRGAVSLAVALAVPAGLVGADNRDLVVFVTAGVVVLSLVIQGAALPRLVRWAQIDSDPTIDAELDLAGRNAIEDALNSLDEIAARLGVDRTVTAEVRSELSDHRRRSTPRSVDDGESSHERQYRDLKLAVIAHKRATITSLRDRQVIDDTVLRQIQARLDLEELRLSEPTDLD